MYLAEDDGNQVLPPRILNISEDEGQIVFERVKKLYPKGLDAYSNLFNLVKYHNIETPEALESFLESCQNANMQEMVSDFSLNNHPKLWHDFIDYVLYDYNNLTALWEEIKEYNKLKYYC